MQKITTAPTGWAMCLALAICASLSLAPAGPAMAQASWETVPAPAPLPAPAASGMVATADDEQVYYEIHGTTGDWIIFLHGGTGTALSWGNQVPAFAGHNRVLLIESRGHGRSSWNGDPLHYERMADDVVAVMDALAIPAADIVGWSDGGDIAMIMGFKYPDHVRRFVTFGSNADTNAYDADNLARPPYTIKSSRAEDAYRAVSPTPDRWESFRDAVYDMWHREPHMLGDLPAITAPALIAVGQYDAISVAHSQAIVDAIPGAELAVMPEASHYMPLHAPEAFNTAVKDFLDRQ
ncbi:alpha/beta fold hydrolase [Marinibacterium sp. SX1]|uniref:alpha/beta fold hydrolase n=1 Tax=Marinibacterium sp. SX1 TaxID=3388424 RepID=UPI003D1691CF